MADTDWKLGKKVFLLKDEDVHCWFSVMAFKKTQEKAYVVPFRQSLQMLSTIYLQILFIYCILSSACLSTNNEIIRAALLLQDSLSAHAV